MYTARDKSGKLWLFRSKPVRGSIGAEAIWVPFGRDSKCFEIDSELFPRLTWQDEPLEVELIQSYSVPDDMGFTMEDAMAYAPTFLKNFLDKKKSF